MLIAACSQAAAPPVGAPVRVAEPSQPSVQAASEAAVSDDRRPYLRWIDDDHLEVRANHVYSASSGCLRMPFEGRPIEDCDAGTGSWTCGDEVDAQCPSDGVASSPQGTNRAWIAPNDPTEFCVRNEENEVKCSRIPYHVRPTIPTDDPVYRALTTWGQVFIKSDGAAPFACTPECFAWDVQPVQREELPGWVSVGDAGDTHIEPLPLHRRVNSERRTVLRVFFRDGYDLGHQSIVERAPEDGGTMIGSGVYCYSDLGGLVRITEETLELENATWYRTKEACELSGSSKSLGNLQKCVGDACGR